MTAGAYHSVMRGFQTKPLERLFSAFMAFLLVCLLIPAIVFADNPNSSDDPITATDSSTEAKFQVPGFENDDPEQTPPLADWQTSYLTPEESNLYDLVLTTSAYSLTGTIKPGTEIHFKMEFDQPLEQNLTGKTLNLDKTYVVYVQEDFYAVPPGLTPSSERLGTAPDDQPIFNFELVPSDKAGYTQYLVTYNKAAFALLTDELISAYSEILMNVSSELTSDVQYKPFIVVDENGAFLSDDTSIEIGDPDPTDPPTEDDNVNVSKTVSAIYKPVAEEQNSYVVGEESAESKYVDINYLVRFTITVSVPSGHTAPGITKVIERLPRGYTAVEPDSQLKLGGVTTRVNTGWVLNESLSTANYQQWEYSALEDEEVNISAGQSFFKRFYATVNAAGIVEPAKLHNVATAGSNDGESGGGHWDPYVGPKYYDLAVVLNVIEQKRLGNTIYTSDETTTVNNFGNPGDSIHDLVVMANDELTVRATVIAQTPYTMKNLKVALYLPLGYTLNPDDPRNDVWVLDDLATQTAQANHPEDAAWKDLKVYTYSYPQEKAISTNVIPFASSQPAYLLVNNKDISHLTSSDYYLAMEIASFANADGNMVADNDSTANVYPYDDLCENFEPYLGNTHDSSKYHDIGSFEKQIDGRINQHAQDNRPSIQGTKVPFWTSGLPTGLSSEDDFDFDHMTFATPTRDQTHKELFYKKRLINHDAAVPDAPYPDVAASIVGATTANLINPAYPYLPPDGLVRDSRTWFIYRLSINEAGLEDLTDVRLTDTLPDGLRLIYGDDRFNVAVTSGVGVGLKAVSGLPLVVDSDNPGGYIFKDYQLVQGDTVTLAGIDAYNAQNSSAGANYGTKGQTAAGFPDSFISGVKLEVSVDGQTFKLTADEICHAQLDIYLVVTLDASQIQYDKEYLNSAVLEGNNKTVTAKEDTTVAWESNVGAAFVKKYVQLPSGEWVDKNQLNILPGEPGTNQSVTYRVRLRTASEIAAHNKNLESLVDNLGAAGLEITSVSPIVYSGNSGTGTGAEGSTNYFTATGEIAGPTRAISNAEAAAIITASYNPATKLLSFSNPGTIPKWTELFIDFTVNYQAIPHGKSIPNYTGTRVNTLQPLKLNLSKVNIAGEPLVGADFEVYYAQDSSTATAVADRTNPVLDKNGNPVLISGTDAPEENYPNSFEFIPTDYDSNHSWTIVLVEVKTPDRYQAYLNSEYAVNVSKNFLTGDLSFSIGPDANLTLVHGLASDGLTVLNAMEDLQIACEVDKDTIRRTSAAYVSLPNHEGINNVGEEQYRYDFDFRSTSNIDADEFVVDDPLENVRLGQIRIEQFWTPVVWGDIDGLYNLWYKTNKTDDHVSYSEVTANPNLLVHTYPNTGFRLWQSGLDASSRVQLNVSALGLATDEYITAIRLEYGAVKVGFTSKNYSDVSLNGEHRSGSHSTINLPSNNADKIELLLQSINPVLDSFNQHLQGTVVHTADSAPLGGITGDEVDWTPYQGTPYYSAELAAATAAGQLGLLPAQYLVSAQREMSDEDIVSSVTAHIARGSLKDQDQDAVVTRELVTFTVAPTPEASGSVVLEESHLNTPDASGFSLLGASVIGIPGTGDTAWTVLMLALILIVLAVLTLILRKLLRKHDDQPGAQISRSYLNGVQMIGSHATGSSLVGSHFDRSKLRKTDLTKPRTSGADIVKSHLPAAHRRQK